MGEVKTPGQTVFLFVGGPLDGQRRGVGLNSDGLPPGYFRCHQAAPRPVWDGGHPELSPFKGPTVELYEYKLLHFMDANGHPLAFYVGRDVPNPMARLLAGYKPETVGGGRRPFRDGRTMDEFVQQMEGKPWEKS